MLNPNATITGKMWGNGIYFAPSSMKSWGYTSVGKWVQHDEITPSVFMGLYETAYGTPYIPTSLMNGNKKFLDENHANCIHAKQGVSGLLNDEIIFFDEAAMAIQYLVEFVSS